MLGMTFLLKNIFYSSIKQCTEGDGWDIAMVERRTEYRNDLVATGRHEFDKAIAIVKLPCHVKVQVLGNWID